MKASGFILRKLSQIIIALIIVISVFPIPTHIAKAQCSPAITVANLNSSGPGSLKQALADICAGGTITFDPSLNGGTIYANSHPGFNLTVNLTIQGLQDPPGITLDGAGIGTTLYNNTVTSSVSYLTIQHGGDRGIINRGTLTLDHVNVINNTSTSDGGGINNWGTLTTRYTTISGNSADQGGGVFITAGGSLTMENSTISGNTATYGGGVYVYTGNMNFTNVTITSNSNYGIFHEMPNTFNYTNTIVSGNAPADIRCTPGGLHSYGHNMMRALEASCTITDHGGGTDLNGTPGGAAGPDPLLATLADNGGFGRTHALNSGSPAIDMGGCAAAPADDQRDVTRPLDGGSGSADCDSGAFEAGAVLPVATSCSASGAAITGLNTIDVTFNTDMASGGGAQSADNTANYILVEKGANGRIDTRTCREGVIGDDVAQTISVASYDNHGGAGPYTATLTLADALDGAKTYRLFVCGTSSIWSTTGLKLNNGRSDAQYNFGHFESSSGRGSIGGSEGGAAGAAGLPGTGFPPGYAGVLPVQPRGGAYAGLSLTLEIPRLKVSAAVVGVPRAGPSWDVTWLGRQVGYLEGSAFPTWDGNSVLTGHVWDADNSPGIFVDLKKLSYGDKVKIRAFGKIYTYEVREQRTLRGSQVSTVFKHEARPWLTLLTCEDYREVKGDYARRRIVRAVLTTVTPEDLWE